MAGSGLENRPNRKVEGSIPLPSAIPFKMNLSKIIIAVTGVLYFCVSLDQFTKGNNGMGLTYLGYAASNIGLWMCAT